MASGYNNETQWSIFTGTKQHIVYGNIASLLFGDDFTGQFVLPAGTNNGRNYQSLFRGNANLVSAENLIIPFTTLQNNCYASMFQSCTSLTVGPELPAMSMTQYCYSSMFRYCGSLISAPVLPSLTMSYACYSSMFQGCTSLPQSPELPAPTLVSTCYQAMFSGCSSLSEVTCLATNVSATNCTANWLNGVASTGTFHKAEGMTGWPTGANGIPTGWTTEDITPETPTINLNEPTLSIRVTEPKHYVAYFSPIIATQTFALAQGWNWWAPTVATSIETVEQALGDALVDIQSKQGPASGEATAGDMYRIQTNAACTLSLSGAPMGTATVALQAGPNWFGFIGAEEKPIAEAISVEAAAGDKIVSQNGGFAIYNGTAWQGTLTTLQPGFGYVYVATENKTLTIE